MSTQFSRRHFLTAMGGLACLPLITSCAPKPQPIRVSTHLWPGYEPMYLAQKMGWLDGSKVELIGAATFVDSIKSLEEGKVHAAGVTLDEVLRMREKKLPISVILSVMYLPAPTWYLRSRQ